MILKEIAVERFTFSCANCENSWTVDYDVQHVEDGHGHQHDYFACNGYPILAPTAPDAVLCPACHTTHVHARLTARRATPVADVVAPVAEPSRPSAQLTAEREEAPHLPAG
jgi:hypothetical protein